MDMKAVGIDTASCKDLASDSTSGKSKLKHHLTWGGWKKNFSVQLLKKRGYAEGLRPPPTDQILLTSVTFLARTATHTWSAHSHRRHCMPSPIIGCIPWSNRPTEAKFQKKYCETGISANC